MPARQGYSVTLHRDGASQPWGIRLVGGCDLDKPIVITRAVAGTPAEGNVKPGDEILQIGDYDARDIRHQDAQAMFKNAGNTIRLVIYRQGGEYSARSSRDSSVDPMGLPRSIGSLSEHYYDQIGPNSINSALLSPHSRSSSVVSPHRQELEEELVAVTEQPYRTTPLVLPGAKVKKDFGPTESYLRHHPNPMFRQAPPHPLLPQDIVMKQKVADSVLQKVEETTPGMQVVHKQFNSPIGMYSEQNIVDSINAQTGSAIPPSPSPILVQPNIRLSYKKTVVYDPAKSETYKALQDQELGDYVQEVTPVPSKVFAPVKPKAVPHPVPGSHNVNSIGTSHEDIQQSNTFKRLMHMVQSEGVY
ncbi:PDZ_signaling and DUF4749 domain-containing protein Zasp66 isoform X3 [Rhodnius prolixus]|uniref:PDZ_signaling and DUF4749 domain-containing protein Zasp66 isoform X3 n=1 Tax=Rhodnius prolixus TaxID=13249 RepID=UPI003D187C9C